MDIAVCAVLLPDQDVLYYTISVQLLHIINVHLVRTYVIVIVVSS